MLKRFVSVTSASALAAASLIGFSTPANAAAALTISVEDGSGFTFVEGSDPGFVVSGNADFIASNGTQLRISVKAMDTINTTISNLEINGTAIAGDYENANVGNLIAYTGAVTVTDASAIADGDGTDASIDTTAGETSVFGLGEANSVFSVTNSESIMTSPFTFRFDTNGGLADNVSDTMLLTAWADANNNGAVDSGEISTTQTITFIAPEDVTGSVTATSPAVAGANNFTGKVELNVNEAYVDAADVGVQVQYTHSTAADAVLWDGSDSNATDGILDAASEAGAFALNTAKTQFNFTVTPSLGTDTTGNLAATGAGSKFSLQALFAQDGGGSLTDADDTIGTAITVLTGAVAVSATQSVLQVVAGANAKATSSGTAGTANTADVRLNSEFTALVDLEDASGDNLVGESVVFTFSDTVVLSASKTVTIDGTTYSSDAALALVSLSKVTNSSGRASVTVKTTGFANGDDVVITATADGVAEQLTANSEEADYTADFVEGSTASNVGYAKAIAAGGSLDVAIAVADEFGVAPANGTTRVTLTRATASARTTAANWNYVLPVVDGVASGTIVDNGAGAGSDTITATLSGTDASSTETFTLTYSTAAATDVASITLTDNQGTGDSVVRLDADALPAWHYFLTAGATAPLADSANFKDGATTGTSDTLLSISGTALNAAGVGVAGKNVTLSATGLTFKFTDAAGNARYTRDSINVPTGAGGTFSVNAYSDGKGGATVVTVSSGTASSTTTITFDGGVATALNLSVPATAADGRAVDVIATVTDVAGDPVADVTVTFKATGVGYLSNLSGTSDATGQVVVKLITQNGETGSAAITATATLDGVSTSTVKTVTVGATAASSDKKVNAGSFKGYIAVYAKGYKGDRLSFKAGNDWNVTESLASDFVRVVEYTGAGYTISVPIYINRVLVDTIVVTTK